MRTPSTAPATGPLEYMPITVEDGGDIVVDTGDSQTRTEYKPEQATPYPA